MPTKEDVRRLHQQHAAERTQPLKPEEIRRQMGWGLIQEIQAKRKEAV